MLRRASGAHEKGPRGADAPAGQGRARGPRGRGFDPGRCRKEPGRHGRGRVELGGFPVRPDALRQGQVALALAPRRFI